MSNIIKSVAASRTIGKKPNQQVWKTWLPHASPCRRRNQRARERACPLEMNREGPWLGHLPVCGRRRNRRPAFSTSLATHGSRQACPVELGPVNTWSLPTHKTLSPPCGPLDCKQAVENGIHEESEQKRRFFSPLCKLRKKLMCPQFLEEMKCEEVHSLSGHLFGLTQFQRHASHSRNSS